MNEDIEVQREFQRAAGLSCLWGQSFITGSRVYGTPTADSDLDLVVLVSLDELVRLKLLAEEKGQSVGTIYPAYAGLNLKFEKLDLLVCSNDLQYQVWREGTEQLIARRPVTRKEAIETFKTLRKEAGLE